MIVRVNEFEAIKAALDEITCLDVEMPMYIYDLISEANRVIEEIENRYIEASDRSNRNAVEKRKSDPTYGLSQKQKERRGKPRGWYDPSKYKKGTE